jgi:flagellin
MRAQITGLEVAQKNAKDGISLVQTAEGALTEVHDMLNRMYALAEQAGNGTYDNSVDRTQLNKEVNKLREEIDRIGKTTNFNGTYLFDSASNVDGSTPTGTITGITGVTVSSVSTNDDSLDTGTLNMIAAKSSTNKVLQVNAPSGYKVQTAPAQDSQGNAQIVNGSGTASITWVNSSDSSKTLTVTFNVGSDFNPTTTTTNGTLTLSVPAGSYSAPTANTAQGKPPTNVTLTGSGVDLWVGDFPNSDNKINVELKDINSTELAITDATVNLTSQNAALDSLSYIKDAIDYVSDLRGTLGAAQNRLEHTINNLSVMQENIQDAESTIRDTDVAEEMMKYTKNSILVQSAQAMLAQANQQPQSVLQLLQ